MLPLPGAISDLLDGPPATMYETDWSYLHWIIAIVITIAAGGFLTFWNPLLRDGEDQYSGRSAVSGTRLWVFLGGAVVSLIAYGISLRAVYRHIPGEFGWPIVLGIALVAISAYGVYRSGFDNYYLPRKYRRSIAAPPAFVGLIAIIWLVAELFTRAAASIPLSVNALLFLVIAGLVIVWLMANDRRY